MDAKTLEYMGERVDKARNILTRMQELKNMKEYAAGKKDVKIQDHHHNGPRIDAQKHSRLAEKAKTAVLAAIDEEIALLEQELAEL